MSLLRGKTMKYLMKHLLNFLAVFLTVAHCYAIELPYLHFVPWEEEPVEEDNYCYDYICFQHPFPVDGALYCFYTDDDGRTKLIFRERPEHINLFQEVGGKDPLEGFNRVSFSVGNFFLRWIFRPIGTVYCTIMPRPAIKAVNNIADNVNFPKRFLSCVLQGKFKDSGVVFTRFVVNSTVGVAGIWDASDYFWDMKKRDEDFGQAFASWGIAPGCYVYVPGEGPCNLRGAVGKIFDYALDIKSYVYGAQATSSFHKMLARYEDYDTLVTTSEDPYHTLKNFWFIQRQNEVEDHDLNIKYVDNGKPQQTTSQSADNLKIDYVKMKSYGSQGVEVDTLKAMFLDVQKEKKSFWTYLSLFNTDFVKQGSTCSVKLHKDKDEMDYHFWPQDNNPNAPLILIMPGLGAHHRGTKVLALAEILHAKGFAVAAISSAFNWHFIETASSTDAPGYMPADAGDARYAWSKILPQLREEKNIRPKRIIMLGYSLGAIHALHIAKLEEEENKLGIDRYLAVNPPVNLVYGMKKLDEYFNTHKQWTREEMVERGVRAFGKMMAIAKKHYKPYDPDAPENPEEPDGFDGRHHKINIEKEDARFLVGYSFRMTLQEIMLSMHRRGKLTSLKTKYSWCNKTDVYNEILQMNFRDYLRKVLKYHIKKRFGKDISDEELMAKIKKLSNLKSFRAHFIDNPDIRVVHTMNDFLLENQSRRWLKDIFKEQVVFFEHGGHLGYLHHKKLQKQLLNFLTRDPALTPEQKKYHLETYVSLAAPYNIPSTPPSNSEFHNPL
jgi:ABC-type transporter lipoprotein component MlaA/pimeloyl-ACP methyl ester carboxylesterase